MAQIIDGKAIAADIRQELQTDVAEVEKALGRPPGLNLLLVGEDPASQVYVRNKAKDCAEVGIASVVQRLPATTSQAEVLALISQWNADDSVDGILVQLPLPKHIDEHRVLEAIDPRKDADGFHPMNAGKLMIGLEGFVPCTPAGVVEMLRRSKIDTQGKHIVVVGRSNIVGKPLAILLAQKHAMGNATVTICHTGTPDIAVHTRMADIVVAAVGRPDTITADHVRDGAVVVDVGMNRVDLPDGKSKLVGDVSYAEVAAKASHITPVPGGVGPMTRAMLLVNTVEAARRRVRELQGAQQPS
ncbi:MAG: bifunctional methylenetetrahydrofolate dehydrogenase/methenyltetrahydrofolate cyclohydrolase FolD [Bradyrhizobiaceae bacterium]|nr:bifunctional methylenetetrahydrofolate dehydrogenase/methenyltetrahydrofolate cyclohydrolase FolD [Bradyrhizobiaceae bacterium]